MAKPAKSKTGNLKSISFDKDNKNLMNIHFEDGNTHFIAIPPGRNRIDLLCDGSIEDKYYNYNIKGLLIITQDDSRLIFLDGIQIFTQKL